MCCQMQDHKTLTRNKNKMFVCLFMYLFFYCVGCKYFESTYPLINSFQFLNLLASQKNKEGNTSVVAHYCIHYNVSAEVFPFFFLFFNSKPSNLFYWMIIHYYIDTMRYSVILFLDVYWEELCNLLIIIDKTDNIVST